MKRNKVLNMSIFIASLFHVSGLIGMYSEARSWFVASTPVTLLLMTILIVLNEKSTERKFILFFGLCFLVGFICEVIGTNTGLLFGNYIYGDAMGLKVFGVPILIGVQWFVTVFSIGNIVLFGYKLWIKNKVERNIDRSLLTNSVLVIIGAGLTTLFDFILEPAAISLTYWQWYPTGVVPMFNYVCWFVISGLLLIPFYFTKNISSNVNYFAAILILIQTIFFLLV
jgi:bisanhydrobacterioruberin hydratase